MRPSESMYELQMEITALISCLLSVLPVRAYLSMQQYSSCYANAITGECRDKARRFTGTATAQPCSMRVQTDSI